VAEAALERLDFGVADKAFVQCSDYQGIQFVKKLRMVQSKTLQVGM
jgi:WD repeat-containing protein 35